MPASPTPVYSQQDFLLIPLLNLVAEPIAGSATASAANVGKVYRNTSSGRLEFVLNATTVVSLPHSGSIVNADIAAGAAIALTKLATDPLARANHTGTQLAATVSDFDTQVRTSRLDQMAAPTADVSLNTHKITNLLDAVGNQDAAAWGQVQNLVNATINGQDWKASVRVAATTNITISGPGAAIDGVTLANGDRVLLTGQTTTSQNGIYIFNGAASAMTRATDADASAEVTPGMTVPVEEGTSADKLAILTTNAPITLGTTGLAFTFISGGATYVAGTGLTLTGNSFALTVPVTIALGGTGATDAATARTNLNTPQRGYAATLGALSAGVGTDVVHSLGTTDVISEVHRISDGAKATIAIAVKDANTVTVMADIAVSASALRIKVQPNT